MKNKLFDQKENIQFFFFVKRQQRKSLLSLRRNHPFWKDYGNMILKSKSSLLFLSLYPLFTVRDIRNSIERFCCSIKRFFQLLCDFTFERFCYIFMVKVSIGSRLFTLHVPVQVVGGSRLCPVQVVDSLGYVWSRLWEVQVVGVQVVGVQVAGVQVVGVQVVSQYLKRRPQK